MKPPPFEYHAPRSVDEALALLAEHGDDAKVLAGGQSLVPLLNLRLAHPAQIVDINRVGGLDGINNGTGLQVGALVRHRTVERSPDVATANPLLAGATRLIGHAAIRNRGTIGGSLAHADPAAELPAVLLALGGQIEARSSRGTRRIPADQFFLGFLSTALEPDELVTGVQLGPWPASTGWSFQEFSRRSGDFAIAGVAAAVTLGADGRISEARIGFSGVATTPVRAEKAEAAVAGQLPSDELWAGAAQDAASQLEPPSDLHGSSAYRRHLAAVLLKRAFIEAHQRAEVAA